MVNSYAAVCCFIALAVLTIVFGIAGWRPGFAICGALMVVAAMAACTEKD